jgi:hypothetical protein
MVEGEAFEVRIARCLVAESLHLTSESSPEKHYMDESEEVCMYHDMQTFESWHATQISSPSYNAPTLKSTGVRRVFVGISTKVCSYRYLIQGLSSLTRWAEFLSLNKILVDLGGP